MHAGYIWDMRCFEPADFITSYATLKRMRQHSIAYVLFLGFIAGSWAAFGQIPNPEGVRPTDVSPKIPVPSGPFGIGRVGYDWVDPSRPDRHSTEPNAHRELMVYFWIQLQQSPRTPKGHTSLGRRSGWTPFQKFRAECAGNLAPGGPP
jgi:hypothetical protein